MLVLDFSLDGFSELYEKINSLNNLYELNDNEIQIIEDNFN